ncbi:ATPase, T2SS/T4P/T4SS family [Proteus sp. DFP240708]|uniref:ATPase, T2SS/T4P/T4SS family n=1 Tax=Proteus TaxID=583 RepID=UPI0018E4B528|nr:MULTISPECIES: ATPase, T2SS/T4P/T4SS family [Proteus]MBI6217829.1 Flp pilus assembly complex ATPase component TadA [Proteus vulgaris]MBI6338083.1 Flp pilus assembly complex ATPase component TadA [Proteus sp. PR00224]MBI6404551.1 Flp pilus assembly complex ATPase component TadA [Proteus sp. PR00208]MBI6544084.1 Flp pilus assembly complex ATPase component TadA [Proteus vulgaris]
MDITHSATEFIEHLLRESILKRVSDLHIEPQQTSVRIRARIDNHLYLLSSPPDEFSEGIVTRLKVLANLNIAEKRLPQDGQFSWSYNEKNYSIRIATLPTLYGEKVVLRLINNLQQPELNHLGFQPSHLTLLKKYLNLPQGMILVTGPTGSGKTLTLYSCLHYLNKENLNINSVEDPIELPLKGINQIQISEKSGISFTTILRALLRQDPDIIMVGEIRDQSTAEMAIKSAQTGHLVLSTLHTNSASSTLMRLYNLGIEKDLIHSCVSLIISQRLVRCLCPHCKICLSNKQHISINKEEVELPNWQAVGCQQCCSGYSGRTAIYECFEPSKQTHSSLYHLLYSGFSLIKQGITTLEEVYQTLGDIE